MGVLDRMAARIGDQGPGVTLTLGTVVSVETTTLTCRVATTPVVVDLAGVSREKGVTYLAGERVLIANLPGGHRIAIMTIED